MKKINTLLVAAFALATITTTSCVDELKFGNSFLEKPPGGTVTFDTVFSSAEYTKQFLVGIYSLQYYGLYYDTRSSFPYAHTGWQGKWEILSDLWQSNWASQGLEIYFYSGLHTSGTSALGKNGEYEKWDYLKSNVWETVRYCWIMLENIDEVPDLTQAEKDQMIAETKCLLAARYWDTFRHYGGLPLIEGTFSGSDASYELPRASAAETVKFMVDLLDDAIPVLDWAPSAWANDFGRWTKAGAMGLKTSILLFAASPLFNDSQPYHPAAADMPEVWYGGYYESYWDDCLKACEEFFTELNSRGVYSLNQATGTRPQDYRAAFRRAYWSVENTTEVLHSTRVATNNNSNANDTYYVWHSWQLNSGRSNYNPTQEYIEMFPWADGRNFDWTEASQQGKLSDMFFTGDPFQSNSVTLTRDPRLYETAIVNGLPASLDISTGNMSGNPYEMWVGGASAGNNPETQSNRFATGYGLMKWLLGTDARSQTIHWSYIRLPEVMLNYAEALCHKGGAANLQKAVGLIDDIRARVGLPGLAATGLDLTNQTVVHNEIMRERACELGMEDSRWFDIIRYKMKDRLEHRPHMLLMKRTDGYAGEPAFGNVNGNTAWPASFTYERVPITSPNRVWWDGFDTKWYLSPFPLAELNKDYGLVQNPGW